MLVLMVMTGYDPAIAVAVAMGRPRERRLGRPVDLNLYRGRVESLNKMVGETST